MISVIEKAMTMNNTHALTLIPYHFLTRIEKANEKMLPLEQLKHMMIKESQDYKFCPFIESQVVDQLLLDYQPLCRYHMKSILDCQEKPGDIIYISMAHIKKEINHELYNHYFAFQFHLVLELVSWDDQMIIVKPVVIKDQLTFLKHQHAAREKEKTFNLIYQLQHYIHCPYCVPTLCSTFFYYKQNNQVLPKVVSHVNDHFKKAFVLVKDDRVDLIKLFNLTQIKWHCNHYDDYIHKIEKMGEQYEWQYHQIIEHIHKLHYNTMKFYERSNEQQKNVNHWHIHKCDMTKTSSPSWRSKNVH